jgi:hypothetical protein
MSNLPQTPFKPSPCFQALRGAVLGLDSESRKQIRDWFDLNKLGDDLLCISDWQSPVVRLCSELYYASPIKDREHWRRWLMKWIDADGNVVQKERHVSKP